MSPLIILNRDMIKASAAGETIEGDACACMAAMDGMVKRFPVDIRRSTQVCKQICCGPEGSISRWRTVS